MALFGSKDKFCTECGKKLDKKEIVCTNCRTVIDEKKTKKRDTKAIIELTNFTDAKLNMKYTRLLMKNGVEPYKAEIRQTTINDIKKLHLSPEEVQPRLIHNINEKKKELKEAKQKKEKREKNRKFLNNIKNHLLIVEAKNNKDFNNDDVTEIKKELKRFIDKNEMLSEYEYEKKLKELIEKQETNVNSERIVNRIIGKQNVVNSSFNKKLGEKRISDEASNIYSEVMDKITSDNLTRPEVEKIIDEVVDEFARQRKIENGVNELINTTINNPNIVESIKNKEFTNEDVAEINNELRIFINENKEVSNSQLESKAKELIEKQETNVNSERFVNRIIGGKVKIDEEFNSSLKNGLGENGVSDEILKVNPSFINKLGEKGVSDEVWEFNPSFTNKLNEKGIPNEEKYIHSKVMDKITSDNLTRSEVEKIIDECIEENIEDIKEWKLKEEEEIKRIEEKMKRREEERKRREIRKIENTKSFNVSIPYDKKNPGPLMGAITGDIVAGGAGRVIGGLAGASDTFGMLGGAATGGLLLGGLGAVVGAVAAAADDGIGWYDTRIIFNDTTMVFAGKFSIPLNQIKHVEISHNKKYGQIISLTLLNQGLLFKVHDADLFKKVVKYRVEKLNKKINEKTQNLIEEKKTEDNISSEANKADALMKYAELYEKGLLTKEEFEAKKKELL